MDIWLVMTITRTTCSNQVREGIQNNRYKYKSIQGDKEKNGCGFATQQPILVQISLEYENYLHNLIT